MAKRRATAELASVSTLRNVMEGYLLLSCSYTGAMALQGLWGWDRGAGPSKSGRWTSGKTSEDTVYAPTPGSPEVNDGDTLLGHELVEL